MKKFIFKILLFVLIICLAVGGLLLGTGYSKYSKALKEVSFEDKLLEIRSDETYTKIDDIDEFYLNAVVAVEDHRFYEHKGIDVVALLRAMARNVRNKELLEGGSTITQQLAKNTYFTQNKEISRKMAEAFMAAKYERELSKDEILELYVNTSYFGDGYYNVYDASMGYFEKTPSELNEYEASMLAGVPNAPSVYSPNVNFELASQRQRQVLEKMVKYEYITENEKNEILSLTEEYRLKFAD